MQLRLRSLSDLRRYKAMKQNRRSIDASTRVSHRPQVSLFGLPLEERLKASEARLSLQVSSIVASFTAVQIEDLY
ncbi:hypothetical protein Y032_0050g2020 [Ancylostoma ceylanicum]|uniref:Uncharacterized protein n=1 Tax=Ancylostoma ceylanicum TaxID=53326 RepID=A0A016U8M0_9BILA|nr:hypothetical protein Y032_0050g2020 [Ancylostoma ceylanicum]